MMRMSNLCRKSAARLTDQHYDEYGDDQDVYMCRAAETILQLEPGAYKFDTKMAAFRDLLVAGGIESMKGDLFKCVNFEFIYNTTAQPVRFMYLSFLAEMLEAEGH